MPSSIASSDPKTRAEANAEYRSVVSASVQEIMILWERVCGEQDAAALAKLHRLSHNLNGACSLLGFVELGKAARALEQRVAPLLPLIGHLSPDELGELYRLTDALRRADAESNHAGKPGGGLVQ